jgi:hypothetical protein
MDGKRGKRTVEELATLIACRGEQPRVGPLCLSPTAGNAYADAVTQAARVQSATDLGIRYSRRRGSKPRRPGHLLTPLLY